MESTISSPQACHNCRRQRRKCDRSLPQCRKCFLRGQDCLGYQSLLRWECGIASRGKMVGLTFGRMTRTSSLLHRPLTDPLVQDMSPQSRTYLSHFAGHLCRHLVLYDHPDQNPFRALIPLTKQHPILYHIIIANAALHMSNACKPTEALATTTTSTPTPCSNVFSAQTSRYYHDALKAKQRTLLLLKSALSNMSLVEIDVLLAVVLLFVEFELIDSGRDDWRSHLQGAKAIVEQLDKIEASTQADITPLRSCLIYNCVVFDILGSTLAGSRESTTSTTFSSGAVLLLQDAEGNHCSSFPVILLELIRRGAHILETDETDSLFPSCSKYDQALDLLTTARSFNPHIWAVSLQSRSPSADLALRTHIASAHRAAVCIYLSRVISSIHSVSKIEQDLPSLVDEVLLHLSCICPTDTLFTATAWPTFIAGAESREASQQAWVATRLHGLWEMERWGHVRGALGVLERLWDERRVSGDELAKADGGWMSNLRTSGVDWLIT